MSNTNPTSSDDASGRFRLVALAVVALIVVAIGAFLLVDGSDDDESSVASTSSTAETTATTGPATTEPATTEPPATEPPPTAAPTTETATTTVPDDPTRTAIWPWVASDLRFDDPVEAAASYATDFLGFDDPVLGEFLAGDSLSGEVEITPGDVGPTTVVFVRQLTEDEWWILGSATENIVLEEPETGDVVESPLPLVGEALAFEGTVEVEIRADGDAEPIQVGFVTGSGGPDPGPFDDELEFVSPDTGGGSLVLISRSPRDDSVLEAASIRIFFD